MHYSVTLDGIEVAKIPATKKAARAWVKANVLSTHMGCWYRRNGAKSGERAQPLEYATTIGRYYRFDPVCDAPK